jgi:hypothetical protein
LIEIEVEDNLQAPLNKKFKFEIEIIELAPKIFRILREKDGLSFEILNETFKLENNFHSVKKT